ncbi:MAG: RecQ family ATP-dependent DNA helicase [Cyanobacteria bacterium J06627_28]
MNKNPITMAKSEQVSAKADLDRLRAMFQQVWGYENFRSPQGEIAQAILNKQDSLIVLPTGSGKSICFQLPALMESGVTLVISPLVALMENQVQALTEKRLPAAALHSELSKRQRQQVLRSLTQNQLRLLYLSPETLLSKPVWDLLCQPNLKINALILDEAHCLTQWGDTFRPTYRRLGTVRPALLACKPPGARIAIAAFTATADPITQKTLMSMLRLNQPNIVRINPYRQNLHLSVQLVWTPKGRKKSLLKFVRQQGKQSGLIYARTRRGSEALAAWFSAQGYSVKAYHGGLSASQRRQIETRWIEGDYQFVVCTSAFGMGIDKPDCRFVAHYEVPGLISEYVQEVGRGGRDGKPAAALSLVSEPTGWLAPEDRRRWQFFEEKSQQLEQAAKQLARKIPRKGHIDDVRQQTKEGDLVLALLHRQGKLQWLDPFTYQLRAAGSQRMQQQRSDTDVMRRYLFTRQCRWQLLLHEFGFEREAQSMRCGTCDRCLKRQKSR